MIHWCVCERYRLEEWRAALVSTNQSLKRNQPMARNRCQQSFAFAGVL